MPQKIIKELLPLRKECGNILGYLCLKIGISKEDFFRYLAKELDNSGESSYTNSYLRCIPQKYILEYFSLFIASVNQAVIDCSTDETIFTRREIGQNWASEGEKFLELLREKNNEARQIVIGLKYSNG